MSDPLTDEGGRAFPGVDTMHYHTGMSLRDYFAAQAITAIYQAAPDGTGHGQIAGMAFDLADAMLAERAKPK